MFLCFQNRILLALVLVAILTVTIKYVPMDGMFGYIIKHSPFAYWFEWVAGAFLADHFVRGSRNRFFSSHLTVLAAGLICLMVYYYPSNPMLRYFVSTLFFTILVWWSLRGHWVNWTSRILGGIGIVSFSLYLIHQPLIALSFEALKPHLIEQQWLIWSVYLPGYCLVIMFLSFAFYKLLEVPSVSFSRQVEAWAFLTRLIGVSKKKNPVA